MDPSSVLLPRIETESVMEKVRTAIRNYVLSGRLKPGTHLVEATLAEQLGVSRAPVREALAALESEGLVVSVENKGTFVAEITKDDLREIYTLRSTLESMAMRIVAEKIDDAGLKGLSNIVERMKQAASIGDAEQVAAIDFEFHRRIWELSGHRRLCQMLNSIMAQIRVFLALNTKVYADLLDNCMEHVVLLQALSQRDVNTSEKLMMEHIMEAGTLTINYFSRIQPAQ